MVHGHGLPGTWPGGAGPGTLGLQRPWVWEAWDPKFPRRQRNPTMAWPGHGHKPKPSDIPELATQNVIRNLSLTPKLGAQCPTDNCSIFAQNPIVVL